MISLLIWKFCKLLKHYHFLYGIELFRLHFVEVNSTGHGFIMCIFTIPDYRMLTCALPFIQQYSYLRTPDIVDADFDFGCMRQFKVDCCFRIERIRIVLSQFESSRYFLTIVIETSCFYNFTGLIAEVKSDNVLLLVVSVDASSKKYCEHISMYEVSIERASRRNLLWSSSLSILIIALLKLSIARVISVKAPIVNMVCPELIQIIRF